MREEVVVVVTPETVAALHCEGCDKVMSEDEAGPPLFECGTDGPFVSDDGHRCPSCNKFASKTSDQTCPDCEGELTEVNALVDPETEELHADEAAYAQAIEDRKPANVAKRKKQDEAQKKRNEEFAASYDAMSKAHYARLDIMLETIKEGIDKIIPVGLVEHGLRDRYVDSKWQKGVKDHGSSFAGGMNWEEAYVIFSAALGREPDPAVLNLSEAELAHEAYLRRPKS